MTWWLRIALVLGAAAALLAGVRGIYSAGFSAGQAELISQQQAELRERTAEEQRLAAKAATRIDSVVAEARDHVARLQEELDDARTALVVPRRRPVGSGVVGPGTGVVAADQCAGAAPAAGASIAGPPSVSPDVHVDVELRLTRAAVRMWNEALVGHAIAGSAGEPAAAAAGAGAAGSAAAGEATELTVNDAWANHLENAARCRIDRARHQELIDFIRARQGQTP